MALVCYSSFFLFIYSFYLCCVVFVLFSINELLFALFMCFVVYMCFLHFFNWDYNLLLSCLKFLILFSFLCLFVFDLFVFTLFNSGCSFVSYYFCSIFSCLFGNYFWYLSGINLLLFISPIYFVCLFLLFCFSISFRFIGYCLRYLFVL